MSNKEPFNILVSRKVIYTANIGILSAISSILGRAISGGVPVQLVDLLGDGSNGKRVVNSIVMSTQNPIHCKFGVRIKIDFHETQTNDAPSFMTSCRTVRGTSDVSRHLSPGCSDCMRIRIWDRKKTDLRATIVPLSEGIVSDYLSWYGL